MAIRSVATSDTLETFRTTFNTLGTDVGDLTTLNTTEKSTIVGAVNEALGATFSFVLRDESSTTQTIFGNDTLNVVGSGGVAATVSATDTLTISLDSTISGLTSFSSASINATTTLTENNVRVATKPFAIAQAIALG